MDMVKRGRGRPRKIRKSLEDELDDVILKAYNFNYDKCGNLKIIRNTTPLSLEETALLIWANEGRKTPKPLSKMQIIKTERSALAKIKSGLAKYGIKGLDDIFDKKLTASNDVVAAE